MSHNISRIILRLTAAITMAAVAFAACALPLSHYADNSVLANGKWVKISISESGVYKISRQQLRQWGFTDMSKVHIYGYGGQRIPDRLTQQNYTDDLPLVQSETLADGIVFYGVGPEKWVVSSGDRYHREQNIYTDHGFYFVSDRELPDAAPAPLIPEQGDNTATSPVTSFWDRLHYETDAYSPGEAGYVLVGENLKNQNNREFTFSLPSRVADSKAWMECAVATKTYTPTSLTFSVNGEKLPTESTDKINAVNNSVYIHAGYTVTTHTITQSGDQLKIRVGISDISVVSNAWLNYISVNYERRLAIPASGHLNFWSSSQELKLDMASKSDIRVWDVTNPASITKISYGTADGAAVWTNSYAGTRSYVAWSAAASLPSPTFAGNVGNQNIHGMPCMDMIIFTLPEFRPQAQRIAALHSEAERPLKVTVLSVDDVYNEFASGMPDVSALRKCLKLFYDRGIATDTTVVSYALLMGRATYDNRHLTSQFAGNNSYNTIPYWMGGTAKSQFSDNDAFGTDDFIAMLDDDSGTALGLDNLCVAVGRMPVTSPGEARNAVDKLEKYLLQSKHGTWRNSFLFLADDGDKGIHLEQTENMISCMDENPLNHSFISKVYIDAYDLVGGVCEGGRKDMYRMLDEGVMWWNFCGHANNHSWTGENIFTYQDINNLYLKNVPILMAATCDFLRWDSNTLSGGEILFHEPNGGTIATISATRPVYISDNGLFTKAMGRAVTKRTADGLMPRLGDVYRTAKNNILTDSGERRSNSNRLRFVLMGDPAMPLATPSNIVRIDSIGDTAISPDAQPTIKAMEQTTIYGSVCTPGGEVIEDFNGVVSANIYDAEKSITTLGVRDDNVKKTFEHHGDLLFCGNAPVANGRFELKVAMPGEVADNFRPATLNAYAYTTSGPLVEAAGVNRDFYVYGYDENVEADQSAPVIHSMVLNDASFQDGDDVNTSPMMIAEISDNVGINLSTSGIGHQMSLTIDSRTMLTDVSLYYTPNLDGTPGGTINYPLEELSAGEHTLTLRVWDTAANSASQTISFNAVENLKPSIYRVYTDVNPARTEVKFYITHNRPEAELTAMIEVFDLLGRKLWDTTAKVPSDMHTSYPVNWDLTDSSGHRVPRGIYLYRASISDNNGESYTTATQRLAVTAQ